MNKGKIKFVMILVIIVMIISCKSDSESYFQEITKQDLSLKKDWNQYIHLLTDDELMVNILNSENKRIRVGFFHDKNNIILNKQINSDFNDSIIVSKEGVYTLQLINEDTSQVDYSIEIYRKTVSLENAIISQLIGEKYDTNYSVVENMNFEIAPKSRKIANFELPEKCDYWMYLINTIDEAQEEKIVSNSYLDNIVNYGLKKLDRLPIFSSNQVVSCFFSDQISTSHFSAGANVKRWNNFKMGNDVMKLYDIVNISETPDRKVGIAFENKNSYQIAKVAVFAISFNIDTLKYAR